ncbi:Fatty acid hydroxylase [Moelleriella libera RCEF 2490]|uniref:Fatty acid hydroxylase n=1 Tax=Moelleriella libera RCEF 2490 TaxID=1081109 RepID=A0A168FBY5_9HYPO|nr:Fatty acid hydroxylase [Moelleriella libera RCEF 2490]
MESPAPAPADSIHKPEHYTTTTTTTVNPKDSIKSTWRFDNRKNWTIHHWILDRLNAHHWDPKLPIPVHEKTDPVPYMSQLSMHAWILLHAAIPLVVQQAYVSGTGTGMPAPVTILLYTVAFIAIVLRELEQLRRLGHRYGFLDGDKHDRDGIPDAGVRTVLLAGPKTGGGRMAMAVLLTYNPSASPQAALFSSSSWAWWAWLPLQIGLYGIVLDFWFYWYHRAMHDIGPLWHFHRRHHLTKHPVPTLAPYADEVQEVFDMVGIPFLTWLTFRAVGIPLDFYSWWICHEYIAFTEFGGHSGIRVHVQAPSTLSWLLRYLDLDLVVEDHDLHHRFGWRKSFNYGKQTRVWDRLFGTARPRIEMTDANIDWHQPVHVSVF